MFLCMLECLMTMAHYDARVKLVLQTVIAFGASVKLQWAPTGVTWMFANLQQQCHLSNDRNVKMLSQLGACDNVRCDWNLSASFSMRFEREHSGMHFRGFIQANFGVRHLCRMYGKRPTYSIVLREYFDSTSCAQMWANKQYVTVFLFFVV